MQNFFCISYSIAIAVEGRGHQFNLSLTDLLHQIKFINRKYLNNYYRTQIDIIIILHLLRI